MPPTDIIVIEDDPMVGEISRGLLADEGYNVLLVQDSREAITAIKSAMPKLIIVDIMMPGVSGMDICKIVKSDPELQNIKVIVMSAKSFVAEKQRALQFGADLFLTKPYSVKTFAKIVKSIMDSSMLD